MSDGASDTLRGDEAREWATAPSYEEALGRIAALQSKNERLREALREIAAYSDDDRHEEYCGYYCDCQDEMVRRAREAMGDD